KVGGDRVDLLLRERAGLVEGLRPIDVAPERGGVLPEAPDRQGRLASNERVNVLGQCGGGERTAAAGQEPVLRVLGLLAVARGASRRVDGLAERGRPAALR